MQQPHINGHPMNKQAGTFSIPYKKVIAEIVEDSIFLSEITKRTKVQPVRLIKLIRETMEYWLDDLLIKPLEDIVFKSRNVNKAEELYSSLTPCHETDMELFELVTGHPLLQRYIKPIEESIRSSYDMWEVEKTDRYIHVQYHGDFRIRYFNKNVKEVTIDSFVNIRETSWK